MNTTQRVVKLGIKRQIHVSHLDDNTYQIV